MFSFETKVSNKTNSSHKFKNLATSRRKLTRSLAFKVICCHFSYFGKKSSIGESMWFESHGAACNRCYFPFMLSHSNKITALYIPSNTLLARAASVGFSRLFNSQSLIYLYVQHVMRCHKTQYALRVIMKQFYVFPTCLFPL